MALIHSEYPIEKDVKADVVFNADNPLLMRQLSMCIGAGSLQEKMGRWYRFVRDAIRYESSMSDVSALANSASRTLENQKGHGIQKSILFATGLRALGVPSRLGLARVQNHLSMQDNQDPGSANFTPHGYAAYWDGERWIKCTPVFGQRLCRRMGAMPLPWTPESHSVEQPLDEKGNLRLQIVQDFGLFSEWPTALILAELERAKSSGCRKDKHEANVHKGEGTAET